VAVPVEVELGVAVRLVVPVGEGVSVEVLVEARLV